jgi:hypothetical protein
MSGKYSADWWAQVARNRVASGRTLDRDLTSTLDDADAEGHISEPGPDEQEVALSGVKRRDTSLADKRDAGASQSDRRPKPIPDFGVM